MKRILNGYKSVKNIQEHTKSMLTMTVSVLKT